MIDMQGTHSQVLNSIIEEVKKLGYDLVVNRIGEGKHYTQYSYSVSLHTDTGGVHLADCYDYYDVIKVAKPVALALREVSK